MKKLTGIFAIASVIACQSAFAVSIQMPMVEIGLAGKRVEEFELTNKDVEPVKVAVKVKGVAGEESPNVVVWPPIVEIPGVSESNPTGGIAKFRVQVKHGVEASDKEVPFDVLWQVVLPPAKELQPNTLSVAPRGILRGYVSKSPLETNLVASRVKDGIKLTNEGGHFAHIVNVRINGQIKQLIEYVYAGRSIVVPIKEKGSIEFLDLGGGVLAKISG